MARYASRHFYAKGARDGAKARRSEPPHLRTLPAFAFCWYTLGYMDSRLAAVNAALDRKAAAKRAAQAKEGAE